MITRILSSILGLPFAFFIVLSGGIWLKLGTLFVSLIGMYEFYKSISKKVSLVNIFGFLFAIAYISILNTPLITKIDIIFLIIFLPFLTTLVFFHNKINVLDLAVTLLGFFYIPFTFSYVYLIRTSSNGIYTVFLPFLCAWLSDTGCYFTGITLGKHKLTPTLSPKKTIEGAIGGITLSTVITGIFGFVISKYFHTFNINFTLFCTIIGFIGSIFAQLGDLTASSIKRKFKIKDYGNLIPGHGGILDRFDSIIFTSCIVYISCKFLS